MEVMTPRRPTESVDRLTADLERTGFYPELVATTLREELEGRSVNAHLVHVDTHFDYDDVHRHITVLALSEDVLAAVHLSDFPVDDTGQRVRAQVATELIPVRRLDSVVVTTQHSDPQRYRPTDPIAEMTLAVTWAGGQRLDLIPATCPDPDCTADHGFTGTLAREDLTLRVAAEAEGQESVDNALTFARALRRKAVEASGR